MFPAYLIRASIDWVRHNEQFQDSNPYSRCQEVVKVCEQLWEQQIGKADLYLLEPASVAGYWAEFFHAEDPLLDEKEWKEGLIKRSGQYDSFDEWQEWFKRTYAQVYKDDNIWVGVLMSAWAHTHQYEVLYTEDSWEFRPSTSYLPTSEMWRIEPHMQTAGEVLQELWQDEVAAYKAIDFTIDEQSVSYLGKVECLGIDRKRFSIVYPPRANKERQLLDVGEMVADIVLPAGDDWYRHLDNIIFADDVIDITALVNRAQYVFGSKRRLLELSVDQGYDQAKIQVAAEGWLAFEAENASA